MRFDLSKVLVTRDGDPMQDGGRDITVARSIVNALDIQIQGEQIDGEKKAKRFYLGTRIFRALGESAGIVDLTADEIVDIQDVVGKLYAPIVVGQVYVALNYPIAPAAE